MDFLDKLISPQSSHHMVLIKYLLVLTFLLFIPYVSILTGSMIYSLFGSREFKKTGSKIRYRFSKETIDSITFNKGVAFILGFVPLLSSVFGYAQLLDKSGANVPEYIFIALVFFVIASVLIYTYKYTFHAKDIFGAVGENAGAGYDSGLVEEAKDYGSRAGNLNRTSGKWGMAALLISVYLFIGANQLALDRNEWAAADIFTIIFSLRTLLNFFQFLAVSTAITSVYIFYRNSKSMDGSDEYAEYSRQFSLKTGLISVIILPFFVVINLLHTPPAALSYAIFGLFALAVVLIAVIANMFYLMIKNSNVRLGPAALYLFVILIGVLILKDQYAFDTTSKTQFAVLAANYDAYRAKLNEEMGIGAAPVSGADIYNGRCIACHAFDHKVVGPPYNSVLPKFEGKRAELIKFILNPVKIDPNYPAMPNQGLKPNEAEAVAEYIMSTYKK